MTAAFDLGENRHIKLKIHSVKNDLFEIESASYILWKKNSDEPEDMGSSNIYEHIIDTVICPKEAGEYVLKITYHIADEVLIENIKVLVL